VLWAHRPDTTTWVWIGAHAEYDRLAVRELGRLLNSHRIPDALVGESASAFRARSVPRIFVAQVW
jgi:hypothetical protein